MTPPASERERPRNFPWRPDSFVIGWMLVDAVYLCFAIGTLAALMVAVGLWRRSGADLLGCWLGAGGGTLTLVLAAIGWFRPRGSWTSGREALWTVLLCLPLVPWMALLGAAVATGLGVSSWALRPELAGAFPGGVFAYALTCAGRLGRPREGRRWPGADGAP